MNFERARKASAKALDKLAPITVFSCGRERVTCGDCGQRSSASRCGFELGGRKAGQTCSKPLCRRCGAERRAASGSTVDLCRVHHELGKGAR
jgi:hypothetical protein